MTIQSSNHPEEKELLYLLKKENIPYQRFDHQPVFTCEESEGMDMQIPGAHTKQLLMRDKKKRNYILAIVMHDKTVDTKALGEILKTGRLSFASEPDLDRLLHVTPGSVTPFGLIFDTEHTIRVIVDEDAWSIGEFRFHPLMNNATLVIDRDGLKTFLKQTEHAYEVMIIPQK